MIGEHLQQLKNEWEPVATDTRWEIEPAYHFIGDAHEQHGSDKECDKVTADMHMSNMGQTRNVVRCQLTIPRM